MRAPHPQDLVLRRAFIALFGVLSLLIAACSPSSKKQEGDGSNPAGAASPNPKTAANPQGFTVTIAYGSEKKTWLEEQIQTFHASNPKTKTGNPFNIKGVAMGSGEALNAIVSGELKAHVFSPASSAYIPLLNAAYTEKTSRTKALSPQGEPVVLSPLVVAMWKPMAEALGWPGKAIGWADLIKINADPKGFGALGHPEWGRFKLGHTHPEYSNSGLLSILAETYAGAKKTRGLSAADLEAKETQDFIQSIEQTIVYYGKSTGFFADKMLERGPGFLSAAVLYENVVIESYSKKTDAPFPIVSIYPAEGTFWSDHPYSILEADWVTPETKEGAEIFLAFLKAKPQQQRALELGFRPADPAIAISAPIDAAHGADPKQPQTLLDVPDAQSLKKILSIWQQTKKASDIVMVFDKSGSMNGKPLAEAKQGAKAFLDVLQPRDEVTLIFFDGRVYPPVGPRKLDPAGKKELLARIENVLADGKTALYDATADAYQMAQNRAMSAPGTLHAVVVMTDGNDEGSKLALSELLRKTKASEESSAVKIFTIAYGDQADPAVLEQMAEAAQGMFTRGSVESIVQVYRDMAAFF